MGMNALHGKLAGLAFAAALATSGLTLVALGAPAYAAAPAAYPTVTVAHADLNLGSEAGVRKLEARVRHAAQQLCLTPGVKTPKLYSAERNCVKQTIANAAPQVREAVARQGATRSAGLILARQ